MYLVGDIVVPANSRRKNKHCYRVTELFVKGGVMYWKLNPCKTSGEIVSEKRSFKVEQCKQEDYLLYRKDKSKLVH